jgi:succinate dehydrogenase/fumarate reductase cytochrome b subunit
MNTRSRTTAPPSPAIQPAPGRPLIGRWSRRDVHRAGGAAVALFAALHLGNHLVALAGVPAHQQALEGLRLLYRHPLVEAALLLVLAVQLVSGAAGVWKSLRAADAPQRKHPIARLQAISGLVLGGFVLVHVAAVLVGRCAMQLDTNFHFAAAGLHTSWAWFFAPYYFLGVAALGVHLGCVAQRRMPPRPSVLRRVLPGLIALTGVVLAGCLVALMAGWLVPVSIPARYLASYPV